MEAMGFHSMTEGMWASSGIQALEDFQVELPGLRIQTFPNIPPHLYRIKLSDPPPCLLELQG